MIIKVCDKLAFQFKINLDDVTSGEPNKRRETFPMLFINLLDILKGRIIKVNNLLVRKIFCPHNIYSFFIFCLIKIFL